MCGSPPPVSRKNRFVPDSDSVSGSPITDLKSCNSSALAPVVSPSVSPSFASVSSGLLVEDFGGGKTSLLRQTESCFLVVDSTSRAGKSPASSSSSSAISSGFGLMESYSSQTIRILQCNSNNTNNATTNIKNRSTVH